MESDILPGSRTGENRHETKMAKVDYSGVASSVPSPSASEKLERVAPYPKRDARNVNTAPSVGLSGFEGPGASVESGIKLDGDFKVGTHPREARGGYSEGGSNAPKSDSVIGGEGASITKESPSWSKAKIPGMTVSGPDGIATQEQRGMADKSIRKESDFSKGRSQA